MRKLIAPIVALVITFSAGLAQDKRPQQESDEVLRITTALVQTDAVVVDKDDQIVSDLKLEDFELYENGKKQQVKFMEFVSTDAGRRTEGDRPAALPPGAEIPRDLSANELKRVIAFVVDDLTIPFEDMASVRKMLSDFVNNDMRDGDLVAIVRTVGGKGLLQQFTSDRQLLRRAIAMLTVSTNPYMAYNNPAPERQTTIPTLGGNSEGGDSNTNFDEMGLTNLNDPNDEHQRLFRGLMTLSTADFIIGSLKEIPGRKSLVLISGGIPIFETGDAGSSYSNTSYMLNQLTDHAVRAGVVVNTMDPRGLRASAGVASFTETPGRSALGGAPDPTFGRGGGSDEMFGLPLAGAAEHLGLATVANATGGVSVVNTNNFKGGLDKILTRSRGYYMLAYTPSDKFDNKFRKVEIKVKRSDVKVYSHRGYVARNEGSSAPKTKEETIALAAKSPIAKRELEVSENIGLKPSPARNTMGLDINIAIDPHKLTFTQSADGKYETSFDVVGFVYDQLGRARGGFSETINTSLTPEKYQEVMKTALTYSANTELPPGYFQIRTVVRETSTGNLGTVARYLEIPDLTKGRLTMSSVFLFAANPADNKAAPTPLFAIRQLSRKQDLRYAAMAYNVKSSGGASKLTAKIIISQGSNVLYQEPDAPVAVNGASPGTKIGQIALAKVPTGRYVLTVIFTDQLADKKNQTVGRSVDFTVIP